MNAVCFNLGLKFYVLSTLSLLLAMSAVVIYAIQ